MTVPKAAALVALRRRRRAGAVVLASLVLAACGRSHTSERRAPPPTLVSPYAGAWLIDDATAHALHSATLYRFGADGRVAVLKRDAESVMYGRRPPLPPSVKGAVTDGKDRICAFVTGSVWKSPRPGRLTMGVQCFDATKREAPVFKRDLVLSVREARPADHRRGTHIVDVVAVGNESGWVPCIWGWAWTKCRDASCGARMYSP